MIIQIKGFFILIATNFDLDKIYTYFCKVKIQPLMISNV
ncbi:MAG: hypothetical protein ACI9E3_000732, partial [Flavobacteriales bacterium]